MEESLELALQSTAAALVNSRLDDAIAQSSAGFNDLAKNMIRFLELRARAWSKKANAAEELKDAFLMMQVAPDHTAGYLCAGKLYAIQGYQDDAMKTFKEGLNRVHPSDLNYGLLQQEYEVAEARSQTRIDFLARCPYEVGSRIISFMTDDDTCVESVMVSRVWRKKLLENPLRWKTFTVGYTKKPKTSNVYELQLAKANCLLLALSRHIEEFNMEDNLRLIIKSCEMLQKHDFPKLRSLSIYRKHTLDEDNNARNRSRGIDGVLLALSGTLTGIYINHNDIKIPPLAALLLICRNLTSIELHRVNTSADWFTGLSLPYTTSLTRLSLSASEKYPVRSDSLLDQIAKLLRCSPALEQVEFNHFSDSILPIIAQYCRNLTHITFNMRGFFNSSLEEQKIRPGSIRTIVLGGSFQMSSVQPLLELYHSTLQALYISSKSTSPENEWRLLTAYPMPLLTNLYVYGHHGIDEFIPAFIRQNRRLENIELENFDSGLNAEVIDAVGELEQVEYLAMRHCSIRGVRFQVLSRCYLRKLEINNCLYPLDAVLAGIGAIESLESLKIHADEHKMIGKTGNIGDFTGLLGRLPNLRELDIDHMNFTDVAVRNLCVSKSLKKATLHSCRGISEEGLRLLNKHGIEATSKSYR